MSEVEKNEVEQTTNSGATAEETKAEPKLSEELQNTGIDYKAKLAEAQKRVEKAESKIVELKRELKDSDDDSEKDDLREQIASLQEKVLSFESMFDQKAQELEMKAEERRYNDAIASVSSSDDEKALIQHILKHDIKPTGDVERDVRRAKLLANEESLVSENAELKQSLVAKRTAGGISTGGQRVQDKEPKYTATDLKFAKVAGINLTKK